MEDFKISVKGFVAKDGKFLVVKRTMNDAHKPGVWEPPGGRLDNGESPFLGLKREIKEETNLDVEILNPLSVEHFVREDGQKITMIFFLCRALNGNVKLTEEHSDFEWVEFNSVKSKLNDFFHPSIDNFTKLDMEKLV